jgi:hypothetical protein
VTQFDCRGACGDAIMLSACQSQRTINFRDGNATPAFPNEQENLRLDDVEKTLIIKYANFTDKT